VKLSRLERFLRLFTEVRAGEGITALLMFLNVFLVLCAYYFIKPLREGWLSVVEIPGLNEREIKAYLSFAQPLVLVPIVAGYASLSTRMSRVDLVTRATGVCMAILVCIFLFRPDGPMDLSVVSGGSPSLGKSAFGLAFYVWVSIFGVFVVAQFWTFAADIYSEERGNRMLPMIAIGGTGGAAFGASFVAPVVKSGQFGAGALLLAALVPLAGSILLTRVAERREYPEGRSLPDRRQEPGPTAVAPTEPARSESGGAFRVIFSSRFMLATAAITLLLSWVNTNGENLLYGVIVETLNVDADELGITEAGAIGKFISDGTTAFYGDFFKWVNICALVLQAVVASRLLKYGGFGVIVLMMPIISLISYTAMALVPILFVIKIMKIAENSTDYSINNTARQVLWLPVSSEMKFKGKPTIDTLFVRLGDGLAAATVLIGTHVLLLSTAGYFAFNVFLVLVWIGSAVILTREHKRLSDANSPPGELTI
jgi:AAA family ATP:ADP antiporter